MEARDKIAANNNTDSGTVTSIVDNYKIGLENLDFGSFRELMVDYRAGLTRYNEFKVLEVWIVRVNKLYTIRCVAEPGYFSLVT